MLKEERLNEIMNLLKVHKFASVDFLVNQLHYSPATIRRDITALANSGVVNKVHGGISLNEHSLAIREHENIENKRKICLEAAKLIPENSTVFLIGSSTTYILSTLLVGRKDITVITEDLKLAMHFGKNGVNCYCIGGKVSGNSIAGSFAIDALRRFHMDICIFSVSAISDDGNISSRDENFAEMVKELIRHSNKSICLCAAKNWGKEKLISCSHISDIDCLITDREDIKSLVDEYPATTFIQAK